LVVKLRANRRASECGYAIRAARAGFDQPFAPQSVEYREIAVREYHPFSSDAGDGSDFVAFAALVQDAATEGRNVQHTLFVA
jgi:hypothetical protein